VQRAPAVTTVATNRRSGRQYNGHQAATQGVGQSPSLPIRAVTILGGSPLFAPLSY
jgi:hypothetical protein